MLTFTYFLFLFFLLRVWQSHLQNRTFHVYGENTTCVKSSWVCDIVSDVCLTNIQHLWWIQATEVQWVIGIVGGDWHLPRDGSICFSDICSNFHGRWALNVWRLDICSMNKRHLHQSVQEMQIRLIFLALFKPKQKENPKHIFFALASLFPPILLTIRLTPIKTEQRNGRCYNRLLFFFITDINEIKDDHWSQL